jgi:hypothetical protein
MLSYSTVEHSAVEYSAVEKSHQMHTHLDFAVILRAHSFIACATTYSTYFYVAKI